MQSLILWVENLVVSVRGVDNGINCREIWLPSAFGPSTSGKEILKHTNVAFGTQICARHDFDAEVILHFANDFKGVVELPSCVLIDESKSALALVSFFVNHRWNQLLTLFKWHVIWPLASMVPVSPRI